jgi:hypothetical protein
MAWAALCGDTAQQRRCFKRSSGEPAAARARAAADHCIDPGDNYFGT